MARAFRLLRIRWLWPLRESCANPAMLRLNVLVSSAERRRQQLLEWQEKRKAAGGGVRADGSAKTKSRESVLLGYSGSGAGG